MDRMFQDNRGPQRARPARPAFATPAFASTAYANTGPAGTRLATAILRFARDEQGSQSVEAMLMLPIMLWCFLATYVFFDAYRLQSLNFRVSYAIGDIISRSLGEITPEYMNSMFHLQSVLIATGNPARLRVTVFRYDADDDAMDVCWSQTRGGGMDVSDSRLATMRGSIPDMADGEVGIMVQSQVDYRPIFDAGVSDLSFDNFTITRPRFAAQVIFNTVNDGNGDVSTRVFDCA